MRANFAQRHDSRVAAVQFLYSWSLNPPERTEDALRLFYEFKEQPREHFAYAEELIHGVLQNVEDIDKRITALAQNWDFHRIARIDLAILRLAIFEILHRKDVPPIVAINEAIDISKEYSSADARRFVNGILDKVKEQADRPARVAKTD
jgi:N utilization substance protein B